MDKKAIEDGLMAAFIFKKGLYQIKKELLEHGMVLNDVKGANGTFVWGYIKNYVSDDCHN